MLINRVMIRCTQVLSKPKWAEMVLTDFGEDRLLASALKDMTCFLLRNPLPGSVLHSKVLWKWYNLLMVQFRLVDQWHRILMKQRRVSFCATPTSVHVSRPIHASYPMHACFLALPEKTYQNASLFDEGKAHIRIQCLGLQLFTSQERREQLLWNLTNCQITWWKLSPQFRCLTHDLF